MICFLQPYICTARKKEFVTKLRKSPYTTCAVNFLGAEKQQKKTKYRSALT